MKCTKCNYVNKVPKWAIEAKIQPEKPKQFLEKSENYDEKSMNYLVEYPDFLSENGSEVRTGRQ